MVEQKKTHRFPQTGLPQMTGLPQTGFPYTELLPDDKASLIGQSTSFSLWQNLTFAACCSYCDQIPNKQPHKGKGLTLAHGFSGYGPSPRGGTAGAACGRGR